MENTFTWRPKIYVYTNIGMGYYWFKTWFFCFCCIQPFFLLPVYTSFSGYHVECHPTAVQYLKKDNNECVCQNREANTLETQLIWYRKCLSLTNCNHFSIPAIVSASFIFGSPSFLQTAPSLSPAAPSFLSRHPLNCRVWVALCRCILPYLPAATAGLMHCRHDASTIYNDPSKWVINFPSG